MILPVFSPQLPGMAWGPGTTWKAGIEVWRAFPRPLPGTVLVTYTEYTMFPGAIVYDFMPTPEAVLLTATVLALYLNRAAIARALGLAYGWARAGAQGARVRTATASLNLGFIGIGVFALCAA